MKQPKSEGVTDSKNTVKPFNLTAQKVGDFTCKTILLPFIFGKFKPYTSNTTYILYKCSS